MRIQTKRRVEIIVVNQNKLYRVDGRRIRNVASSAISQTGLRGLNGVEIIFLTDREIRALNRKYRREDHATDVLSFNINSVDSDRFTGIIYISLDAAFRNARKFEVDLNEEIARYVVHGILHLSGFTDYKAKDRLRMERKQEKILEGLCHREGYLKVLM